MKSLSRTVFLLAAIALIAVACGSAGTTTADTAAEPVDPVTAFNQENAPLDVPDPEAEADITERNIFAGVNIAIADVPLEEVVFDTFDGGSVTLAAASEEQVLRLLNAIPPINEPDYLDGQNADWLNDDDLVLGYVAEDGTAWAYPHRVLNFHEIVNTTFGETPVAITYCPLCGSGLVFDRRPTDLRHDGLLTFDNTSALFENDMVMVDQETNTYWWQVGGRAIVGNLTGATLGLLPSMTTSWGAWLDLHPDTQVLSDDQGFGRNYGRDPFDSYAARLDSGGATPFPTSEEAFADQRLSPGTRIIGFDLGGGPAAVAVLANEPTPVAIEDTNVVLLDGRGGGGFFSSSVNGEPATFTADGDVFIDSVTGSSWNAAGRAVAGPASGEQLTAEPSSAAFWFAWVSTLEGETSRLFGPDGEA